MSNTILKRFKIKIKLKEKIKIYGSVFVLGK